MDNETHEGQVLISASELAELRAIAKKYGRFMREKKKTVEEHATTVQRAVKSRARTRLLSRWKFTPSLRRAERSTWPMLK